MIEKLSVNSLYSFVKDHFETIPDTRDDNSSIKLSDGVMSAFAMFALKEKSLLAFEESLERSAENIQQLFKIETIPSDTHMRRMIDPIEHEYIRGIFVKIFRRIQRFKQLERFVFMDGYYLVSCDGTGYFSSNTIHCENCMQKKDRSGKVKYYHQFYGAAIVHPALKQVIPVAPEAIQKQDGSSKNDCERNAAKRFLQLFKKEHPKLKAIIIEDALASNAPHIREIKKHGFQYILGVKPDDHKFLFAEVAARKQAGELQEFTIEEDGISHIFSYCNDLPLNESNQDLRVNFLEYWEVNHKKNKTQHFTWVTGFTISEKNTYQIMRGGRARWKIENETFNTLKNQDYHFEHNYGHGKKHLSFNLAMLMMLAFLIDQTLEFSCKTFQGALVKSKSRIRLWENIKNLFFSYNFDNMHQIYHALFYGFEKPKLKAFDTS